MSDLNPGFITLNSGLDLQSPKIAAPPGTLLDMLNYEQVDFQGQKRIDGYARYDGSLGSYQDDLYEIEFDEDEGVVAGFLGKEVWLNGKLSAVVTHVTPNTYVAYIALLDQNLVPEVGSSVVIGSQTTSVTRIRPITEALPEATAYDTILKSNSTLRERTTTLPGPVAGLHWFDDRLYAVASVFKVRVDNGSDYYPNDRFNGSTVLKREGDYVYLNSIEEFSSPELVPSDMASLFQSRTEQQAYDELGESSLYGWEFVHQGWMVPFENAVSLYGDLSALNQNRTTVGTMGPTPTTGNSGRALSVFQKETVAGAKPQVNGWKNSDTRTSYVLKDSNIADDDSLYIYADAFVSWEDTATTISAPGLSSATIPEYLPTASVVLSTVDP